MHVFYTRSLLQNHVVQTQKETKLPRWGADGSKYDKNQTVIDVVKLGNVNNQV